MAQRTITFPNLNTRSRTNCCLTAFIPLLLATGGSQTLAADQLQLPALLDLSFEELLNTPITSTSFYDETPLDVAATVSVITRQDWEQRGARRLHDAFSNLPGMVSLPNFLGSSSVRIRGYALADARGIATLWDGVSITSYNLATADVDRPNIQLGTLNSIEVTRGPGSALYGTDAFHGVIALNAFQSEVNTTRFTARTASNGFYSSAYNNSAALSDGWRVNVALGISGQPNQDEDYTYTDSGSGLPATGTRDYNYQSGTATLKLISNQNRKISYKFGFYYDDNDSDKFQSLGTQGGDPGRDTASVDASLGMTKAEIKYRLGKKSSMTLESYYWDQEHIFEQPVSATRNINIKGREHRDATKLIYKTEALFVHTQLSAAIAARHDKLESAHRRIFDSTSTIIDSNLPISGQSRTINSFIMDGKTEFSNKKWGLRYGFRFDDYSDFGEQFSPRLGVIYHLDQQSALKALYGNAFRAPNAIEVGGTPFLAGDPNIKPETMDTYELVYLTKTDTKKFELILFYNSWEDAIASIDTTGNGFDDSFANIGKNNSRGIEVSYKQKFSSWLVDSSASYVVSENELNDEKFTAFPKYIVNLGIGYTLPSNWKLYQNNRFHFNADAGPERDTIPSENLKNYWRADVNLSKPYNSHWRFFANVRNIFDRENYLPSLVNAEGGIEQPGVSIDIGFSYKLQ